MKCPLGVHDAPLRLGADVTTSPERHLIKKYANRKLYDTRTSRYITLEGIAQLVRDGHEIKVVDRDDGRDLTQLTLSQIVLEEEKRGPARLVDAGGQMLLDYVRKTLNVPADIRNEVERRREGLESMVDDAIERALSRLRMPTRRDIDRINERLDRLAAQMKRNGAVTKGPRRRKASH